MYRVPQVNTPSSNQFLSLYIRTFSDHILFLSWRKDLAVSEIEGRHSEIMGRGQFIRRTCREIQFKTVVHQQNKKQQK